MFIQVGGEFATAAVLNMNLFGRIACCGAISGYNLKVPEKRELNLITTLPGLSKP